VREGGRPVLTIGEMEAHWRGAAQGPAGKDCCCRVPPEPLAGPVSRPYSRCRHTCAQPGPYSGRQQRSNFLGLLG
jgi:hypothetical protein